MMKNKTLLFSAVLIAAVFLMPIQAFAGGKKEQPKGSKPAAESSAGTEDTKNSTAEAGKTNTTSVSLGKSEDTVATVNGVGIPKVKLDSQVMTVVQQYAQQGQTLNEKQLGELRSKVLSQLIDQELLYQDAVKNGVKASKEEIKTQLDGIKKQFGSDDAYLKALKQQNITEDYLTTDIGMNIVLNKYVEQKFKPQVTVSDDEDAAFYGQNPNYFTQPEQIRASHILIKVPKDADDAAKAEAKKKIEKVQKRLAAGEEFSALAKEVSEGPSGPKGGDLGYFGRGQMVKPFEDAAFALKKGEVSGIVETQFGYHIIKLTGRKEKGLIPYDKVKAQIHDHLLQTKLSQVLAKYIDTLRADADIKSQVS